MLYRVSLVWGEGYTSSLSFLLCERASLSLMPILACEGTEEVCKPQHDEKVIKQDDTMGH